MANIKRELRHVLVSDLSGLNYARVRPVLLSPRGRNGFLNSSNAALSVRHSERCRVVRVMLNLQIGFEAGVYILPFIPTGCFF